MKISEFPFHAKPRAQSEFGTARAVFCGAQRRTGMPRAARSRLRPPMSSSWKWKSEAASAASAPPEARIGGSPRAALGTGRTSWAQKNTPARAACFLQFCGGQRRTGMPRAARSRLRPPMSMEMEERGGQRRVRAAGGENRRFPTGSARNGPALLARKNAARKSEWGLRARRFSAILFCGGQRRTGCRGRKVPLEAADVQLVEVEERGGQRRVRAAGGENRRFSTGSARNGPHFLGAKKTRHAYKSDWGLRARRFSAILILRRSEADRDAAGGKVSLRSPMSSSWKWKSEAASAASAPPSVSTRAKSSAQPAPPEADDRHLDAARDGAGERQVKAGLCAVGVHGGQQDLPRAQGTARLAQATASMPVGRLPPCV